MVGALQYLTMTRPDITYAVHVVSQFMHVPCTTHLHVVKYILRYLQGALVHGLWFRPTSSPTLVVAYSDADWTGRKDACHYTAGYAMFLGPKLIVWRSKKQPTVSMSSIEAEYRAIGYTVVETVWVHKLLYVLFVSLPTPIRLYCDNLSAISVTANPVEHDHSKHIAL